MNKVISRIIQAFIPSRSLRQKIRLEYEGYSLQNGNEIFIFDDIGNLKVFHGKVKNLEISFKGKNNKIYIHKDTINSFTNCKFSLSGGNGKFRFEKTDRICNLYLWTCCGSNQHFYLGKNSNMWGCNVFLNEENASVEIGEDCMFSDGIEIWATDGHAIIDKTSGEVINNIKEPVRIGNHCWIGAGVRILKNAYLPDGCIAGGGSVITCKIPKSNVIAAGNPAKIIKENIFWKRKTAFISSK